MIKGAIFDADGTIFDSMHIWDTIGETYLRSIGYTPKENLNETFKNMSLYQAAQYYIDEYGVPYSADEIIDGVNNMIENFYKYEVKLKPGVEAFLQNLYDKGVKMCVATATDEPFVKAALVRLKADKYFSGIFTCASVGHGKDEPFIYREALKHLGTSKKNTVVFEDALYAAKTAKKDGFITVCVNDIYEKNQAEIKEIADFYIDSFLNTQSFWEFASAI